MKRILRLFIVSLLMMPALGHASAIAMEKPKNKSRDYASTLECSIKAPGNLSFAQREKEMRDPMKREERLNEIHRLMNTGIDVATREAKESAEQLCTVTCVFEGETYPYFAIYNPGYYECIKMSVYFEQEEEDRYVFQVPAGTYDVCADFYGELNGLSGFGYIIHEDVEVKGDMTISFSQEEANVLQRFQPLLKDGTPIQLPIGTWSDSGLEVDETGANTKYVNYDYQLFCEGCEVFGRGTQFAEYCPEGETTDFYIITNEISDKYHLVINTFVWTEEDNFLISTSDIEGFSDRIVHPYDKYISYPVPAFVDTPLFYEEGCDENRLCIVGRYWMDNVQMGGAGVYIPGVNPEVLVASQPSKAVDLKTVVTPISVQAEKIDRYEIDFGGIMIPEVEISRAEMYSLPAWHNGEEWVYINQNHSECGSWIYQKTSKEEVLEFPGLKPYCFTSEELTVPLGNSAPILVWTTELYDRNGATIIDFYPQAWVGRFGEVRNCDRNSNTTLKITDGEGNVLMDSANGDNLSNWQQEYFLNPHEPGILKATSIDNNILIDGEIKGCTSSTIEIDERKSDCVTPTPQMLIFKDSKGKITDRFSAPAEGILEFSAGDFIWEKSENGGYYSVERADVKVEYTPYGEGDWQEIKVEEVPEFFFMPGFGYFYRGSLESVVLPSSNGWYDLRLTLTDQAGNRTVETLSPAFKIEEGTEVKAVGADGPCVRKSGNRLYVDCDSVKSIELLGIDGSSLGFAAGSSIDVSEIAGMVIVRLTYADGSSTVIKALM